MFFTRWFRPPRHLLLVFLIIVLLPSTLLVVSGWRLMIREEALAMQERQTRMADVVVAALRQRLQGIDARLRDPRADFDHGSWREDFVFVVFDGDTALATPAQRLLYYPVTTSRREVPAGTLADVRRLQRIGDVDGALAAWARLSRADAGSVGGLPLDYFARWAECDLLERAGRADELHKKANALYADLHAGRWQMTRETFDQQAGVVSFWLDSPALPPAVANARLLSDAVESLWRRWRASPGSSLGSAGSELVTQDGQHLTLFWRADPTRLAAFIATAAFVDTQWLSALNATARQQHLRISLRHPSAPVSERETRRPAAEAQLPWTVAVSNLATAETVGNARLQLWIGGVALLSVIVLGGAIVITRATARELAVARLQSDFVAAVSHEFRTPLTSLRQIGEVLHDGRVSDERRRTYYEALMRQTERLHHLVETLLDFGRMEAGRSPYRKQPADLAPWARSVVEQFNREVSGRGYTVEFATSDETIRVLADEQALTNALWNLLDNAVKYSPDCKTVWVRLARHGDTARVDVRDRGLGIPRTEQRGIFGKFVRGAEATRRNIAGTGIGLAMVEHIIKAHDGRVRVESEPGAGSTFTVEIPCRAS